VARHTKSEHIQIVVALIGLVGVICAALITTFQTDAGKAPEPVSIEANATRMSGSKDLAPTGPVKITGVIIGKADAEPVVTEALTRFGPRDEVAITVRYQADESVANFPVRISARVMSAMLNGVREATTDVSRAGNSFWTFRFSPDDEWVGQQFVWIQIDGRDVYGQQFDVVEGGRRLK